MAETKMFFRSGFGYAGFSDLEDIWDDLLVSRLKYNTLDDFQEIVWTSWKSSDGVFSHLSPFHNRSKRFDKFLCLIFLHLLLHVFNQMALIFHPFKGFSDLEDFWDDLPVSRLKYNALDDFQEVFQTTSRKSSSISNGVQACLYRGMIYNSFVCETSPLKDRPLSSGWARTDPKFQHRQDNTKPQVLNSAQQTQPNSSSKSVKGKGQHHHLLGLTPSSSCKV
ncbi:hypothetical protein F2Q68_00003535 [Brassica cretica]|uniref:Uncharacterized protein n=1 Tax=Brassica cretica TaxID=69181 RepID=A0A8S9JCI9_BRACR|nr:hypothetical protein F2Q68_00003535 [Brassica cretica]